MSKVDVKVVLLGKQSVGKTCLVERYLHGKFKDSEKAVATVGAAFGAKKLVARGKEITLGIWDTADQQRYESMSRIYYRGAKAALVCFDLTDGKSFDKVKFWVEELMQNEEGCAIYIVGTKLDLIQDGTPRSHSEEEIKSYAKSISARIYETSAKSGGGIEELFQEIATNFVLSLEGGAPRESLSSKIDPSKPAEEPKQKKCCG